MSQLKSCFKIVLLIVSLGVLTPTLATTPVHQANEATYLFVQSSDRATLAPVQAAKGEYRLTLQGTHPFVSYFSDRPNRVTGVMPMQKFLRAWDAKDNDSFAEVPPNVSVQGIKLHGMLEEQQQSYVFELSKPHYDASKNTITYDAKLLGDATKPELKQALNLKNVSLFIDGWCPGCCCG